MQTDLIPVWTGSTWRQFVAPVQPSSPSRRGGVVPLGLPRVRAVLTDNWQSLPVIRALARMRERRVREALMALVEDGVVEQMTAPARSLTHQGRPTFLYRKRRAQARTEAA